MPELERVELKLDISLNGDFHIHHHHYHTPSASQPGAAEIINSIRELRKDIMTQLDLSTAKESGDQKLLLTAVTALETAFASLQSSSGNTTALQAALDAANLDATTQAAILDANDADINTALAGVQTALGNGGAGSGGGGTVPIALTVDSSKLVDGVVGTAYTAGLVITGGTGPYSVTPDAPTVNGLTMDSNGNVTGTPTVAGGVTFSGIVADSATPQNAHQTFSASFVIADAVTDA